MNARAIVEGAIARLSSQELAELVLAEYDEIMNRYFAGDHRPSQLSGGRFAEAMFRLCQHACTDTHTPLLQKLPPVDSLIRDLENASGDETFRLHIPRCLRVVYHLRNKRDIAHLQAEVSPNFMDSTLVISIVNWALAEIVRAGHQCSPDDAQRVVDSLSQRRIPIIWQEGEVVRVLRPEMPYRDKTLLVLYHLDPDRPLDFELYRHVEHSHITRFKRDVLSALHRAAMIDYRNGSVAILPPGRRYVETELSLGHPH
jgi:hypothetical protein